MEATYISPLTDFGFKKLFGEESSKNLIISFLNDLLPISDKIISISFQKNQQLGDDRNNRHAVYDIFCEDEKNNQFIVEMQNGRQTYFRDRAVFYSTFPIRDQAPKGKWNFELRTVYCIGILGFNMEDKPDENEEQIDNYLHVVRLKDQNNKVFYDKLTYIFIELPKFTKRGKELSTHFEKWIFFLKNSENFDDVPDFLNDNIFQEAFQISKLINFSKKE